MLLFHQQWENAKVDDGAKCRILRGLESVRSTITNTDSVELYTW